MSRPFQYLTAIALAVGISVTLVIVSTSYDQAMKTCQQRMSFESCFSKLNN